MGEALVDTHDGISLTNCIIPGLFFADDVVLMANTENHLKSLLGTLCGQFQHKKLEVNWPKTKVLKMGPGSSTIIQWDILEIDGRLLGTIEETNIYKYLGVKLGRSSLISHHMRGTLTNTLRKVGLIKAMARSAPDRRRVADVLWRQWAKPAILYATEVLPLPTTWIQRIERQQNKMARWILGTSPQASSAGAHGELGWHSIKGEIMKRKLVYYGKILRMDDSRWPRQVMLETIDRNSSTTWRKNIHNALQELGQQGITCPGKNWAKQVKMQWKRWEQAQWRSAVSHDQRLQCYPKARISKKANYLTWGYTLSGFTKMRLGDLPDDQVCKLCSQHISSQTQHILIDCPILDPARTPLYKAFLKESDDENTTSTDKMKAVLGFEELHHVRSVNRLYTLWARTWEEANKSGAQKTQ